MTVAFAGLSTTPYAQDDLGIGGEWRRWQVWGGWEAPMPSFSTEETKAGLRMLYVFFILFGCCLSSIATLVAVRTVLLVNAAPVSDYRCPGMGSEVGL
jgi:hypothetical protein